MVVNTSKNDNYAIIKESKRILVKIFDYLADDDRISLITSAKNAKLVYSLVEKGHNKT